MKLNFKKISAIGASLLLTGMSIGLAAASAYPAPFIEGGAANVAIVYGTGAGYQSRPGSRNVSPHWCQDHLYAAFRILPC